VAAVSPRTQSATLRNFLRQRAYPAFCERLAVVGRPLLLSRAKDITSRISARSCVVLAPHPDDETLGCGATIMRKRAAGALVHIVIATDGRHSLQRSDPPAEALANLREEEARRAGAILGLAGENIAFLRFEDGRLVDHRPRLRDRLAAIVNEIDPDEIFVSSILDSHPDHRVLAEVARELTQVLSHRPRVLYEYPIWFWDPRLWRVGDLLDLRICAVRTEEFRIRKCAAIAAYRSQVADLTGASGAPPPLRRGFLRQFLRREEIFFEISTPDSVNF
jgi:LmbE family N-acetylglucosaminyl deacetylase